MLVVTLAAVVVSGLFWREHVAVRSIENRLALSQSRWIERAAVDWAKVILRADQRAGAVDHLGEPWAVPVVDTRVLAQKVDALALLARWRSTPMRAVRAAIHELEAVNAPITGIALTLVNVKSQAYGGYGYQAYYHRDFKKYYIE